MLGVAADVEQSAVDFGVECLDPPVEHLREARQVADVLDREAGIAQPTRCSAGGNQFDAKACQGLGKLYQAGFVGNAEQSSFDLLGRTHD